MKPFLFAISLFTTAYAVPTLAEQPAPVPPPKKQMEKATAYVEPIIEDQLMPTVVTKKQTGDTVEPQILKFKDEITTQVIPDFRPKQREIYKKIHQLLARSQSPSTLYLAQELLNRIREYPLYPYAQYQLFKAKKETLTLSEVQGYYKRNPNIQLAESLKKHWLEQAQKQKNWQEILTHRTFLETDTESRCIFLEAEAKTLKKNTALSTQWKNAIQSIWLTGDNLPSACDIPISLWQAETPLTNDLIKQRSLLIFEGKNVPLLNTLYKQAKDPEVKTWITELTQLLKNPTNLTVSENIFYPTNNESDDNKKRVYLSLFPNFVKTIKESAVENSQDPFSLYAQWAEMLKLTEQQKQQWQKALVSHLFDSENSQIQQWRDNIVVMLKDDALTERRIRTAIREQTGLQTWLDLLSTEKKNKDEWQYWQAKVLQKSSEQKAQATQILQALSKKRGFYPLLASEELNQPYQPEMQTFQARDLNKVADRFAKELEVINELKYFNETHNINIVWKNILDNASFEQKLALAEYAEKQSWFDLSVEATIQAKAWGYLALRLPNAYKDWFDLHLDSKNITRTFAMAIARQESAWKTQASSPANARGLMQLLPTTAKQTANKLALPYTHESQLFDPFDNIMLGTTHLQELYDLYGNNRILIAAAYNAGASRVDRWLAKANRKLTMAEFVASIPFYETRDYVKSVLAYDAYYQILQKQQQQNFSKDEYNRLY